MAKFFLGIGAGIVTTCLLPDVYWEKVQKAYQHTNLLYKQASKILHYYSPDEINKRKSDEIQKMKGIRNYKVFQFEEEGNDRKNVELVNEIYSRIRLAEVNSNQSGVSKQDRIQIVKKTVEEFYPYIKFEYKDDMVRLMVNKLDQDSQKP